VWIQRLRRRRLAPKEPPTPAVPHWRERGPFGDWIDAALADADEAATRQDAATEADRAADRASGSEPAGTGDGGEG
jgi:hypothetical protein